MSDVGSFVVRVSGKSEAAVRNMAQAYALWMVEEEGSVRAFGAASRKGRCLMGRVQRVKGDSKKEAMRLLLESGSGNASVEDEGEADSKEMEKETSVVRMPGTHLSAKSTGCHGRVNRCR